MIFTNTLIYLVEKRNNNMKALQIQDGKKVDTLRSKMDQAILLILKLYLLVPLMTIE